MLNEAITQAAVAAKLAVKKTKQVEDLKAASKTAALTEGTRVTDKIVDISTSPSSAKTENKKVTRNSMHEGSIPGYL
jgi:hypothetical protein